MIYLFLSLFERIDNIDLMIAVRCEWNVWLHFFSFLVQRYAYSLIGWFHIHSLNGRISIVEELDRSRTEIITTIKYKNKEQIN